MPRSFQSNFKSERVFRLCQQTILDSSMLELGTERAAKLRKTMLAEQKTCEEFL